MAKGKHRSKRVTLTRDQIASRAGTELLTLCQQIADDGQLADVEIGQLKQWLAVHRNDDIPAIVFLNEIVGRVLEDGVVTDAERRELQRGIERILPKQAREGAVASRHRRGLEEWADRAEIKHYYAKVSGVTYNNPDGADRQDIIQECRKGDLLELRREPESEYNSRAVQILTEDGDQIGYLPNHVVGFEGDKGLSWDLASKMDDGLRVEARIAGIRTVAEDIRGVSVELAFWNGPLDHQPAEPYFESSDSSGPTSGSEQSASGCGCLVALVILLALAFVFVFVYATS